MSRKGPANRSARTVLERKIRERRLTFEEFVDFANDFAGQRGEPGTLSYRHLLRLASGRGDDGGPLGTVRPATARLLESIFGVAIDELLRPPGVPTNRTARALQVAIAIVVRSSDVLVVCRNDSQSGEPSWQFPAGVVKPGMRSRTVAVRETLAETGVHCTVVNDLGSRLHPTTQVLCDYVLCRYVTGDARNLDPEENVAVAWVGTDELSHLIPPQQIFPAVRTLLNLG